MSAAMASGKRCYYEVLGLSRDCTAEEIRKSYKKLALQRHPDKLIQSGISESAATAQFQELVHAYEVLSDPKERSWYDNHRSQILFASSAATPNSKSCYIPDLYGYFSSTVYSGYGDGARGFYRVYGEVFTKVYECEIGFVRKMGNGVGVVKDMPLIGDLNSGYDQVMAFYGYWLGFVTVIDFCWVDQYDAMAGVNRKSRRVMEEENKKLRKKARREYNELVRKLAEFVKKRDKRVVDMMRKREEERARKLEEEKERRKAIDREKLERARRFEEPEWTRVDEDEGEVDGWVEDENDEEEEKKIEERKEFYCVVCGKKFRSEKQWKNHEQSKKHKEKVAELRESFADEDEFYQQYVEEKLEDENDRVDDEEVGELNERFKESVVVEDVEEEEEDKNVDKVDLSSDDEEEEEEEEGGEEEEELYFDVKDSTELGGFSGLAGLDEDDDNDERSVLEAMVSGHKKKSAGGRRAGKVPVEEVHVEENDAEFDSMEYNKKAPKNRKARRAKNKKNGRDGIGIDDNGVSHRDDGTSCASNLPTEESTSNSHKEDESITQKDDQFVNSHHKFKSEAGDRKSASKKETKSKSKNSSKGKKAKASSNDASNLCEKCGQEFESRNKLHKHLNETGHASLKHR